MEERYVAGPHKTWVGRVLRKNIAKVIYYLVQPTGTRQKLGTSPEMGWEKFMRKDLKKTAGASWERGEE